MEIKLYRNFNKRINSTKRPSSTPISKNVRLKENTSIVSPTFLLSGDDVNFNYVYVPKWDRYYFIGDISKNIDGVYEPSCDSDVLATFKNQIGAYKCFVERCSNESGVNDEIYDSAVSSTENIIDVKQAETSLWGSSGGVVICRTINASHGITTYIGSLDNFKDLFNPDVTSTSWTEMIEGILEFYVCNPGDYVLDTYFLGVPLSVLTDSGNTTLDLVSSGWYSGGGAYRWTSTSPIVKDSVILNKPSPKYQDWRKSAPAFTQYSIYLPSVGEVPLAGDLIDTTLTLEFGVDINTGEMTYQLKSTDEHGDTSLIATYQGNVKSGLQTGSIFPNGGGMLTSGLGLVASGLTGNPLAIGTSVLNVAQNVISPTPSVNGAMGSCVGYALQPKVVITRLSKDCGDEPLTVGKPCCKNLTLSSIPGYIKTSGASVNIGGFESDKTAINSFLDGGFYYE